MTDAPNDIKAAKKLLGIYKIPRGFSPDERWGDYMDLLPGFAALEKEMAYAVYKDTKSINYKLAKEIIAHNKPGASPQNQINNCYGIGFIEIVSSDGILLLSKELKRWFLYRRTFGNFSKLRAIATVLTSASGWGEDVKIEEKETLFSESTPSYYELGREIENEHRIARKAENESIRSFDEHPHFVDELLAYYTGASEEHQKNTQRYADEDKQGHLNWESDSLEGSLYIRNILGELSKKGVKKVISAKAKADNYQQVYDKLVQLPEVTKKNRLLFTRKYPPVTDDSTRKSENEEKPKEKISSTPTQIFVDELPVDKVEAPKEESSEPTQTPTNLDNALARVQRQLEIQQDMLQQHQDRLNKGILSLSNGHHAVFQKLLDAFKDLKVLKFRGVDWVGDRSELSDEDLFANIRKIKAAIEKNPSHLPQAGTKELRSYLEEIISRPEIPSNPKTSESKPLFMGPPKPPQTASSEPTNDATPEKTIAGGPNSWPGTIPITPAAKPTTLPPVQKEWRRARAILNWTKKNAPAMIVGGVTGAGVRIAAQFAAAALLTTTPGIVATIGSAMAIGAIAGGTSKLLTTFIWGGAKKEDKHWKRKAFLHGAAMGAIGAGIGAGIAQWLISHDYFHGLFSHNTPTPDVPAPQPNPVVPGPDAHGASPVIESTPSPTPETIATPSPSPEPATPTPVASATPMPSPPPSPISATPAPTIAPPETPIPTPAPATPASVETPIHPAPTAAPETYPVPPVVPQIGVKELLTQDQFKTLPKWTQGLASSQKPEDIAKFCKEASYHMINGAERSPETLKVGAKLIERGLEVAKTSGLHNTVTEKLHADFAYVKAWRIGTEANKEIAIEHARQAGSVIHNYGARLLKLFGVPVNG